MWLQRGIGLYARSYSVSTRRQLGVPGSEDEEGDPDSARVTRLDPSSPFFGRELRRWDGIQPVTIDSEKKKKKKSQEPQHPLHLRCAPLATGSHIIPECSDPNTALGTDPRIGAAS